MSPAGSRYVRRAAGDPRIFSDLNGLFLLAVGSGYYLPWRDPSRYRGYLWVMGPFLKGAGAAAFLLDYFLRGSPASFLLFAASATARSRSSPCTGLVADSRNQ